MKCFQIVFATTLFAASLATAQQTSENDSQLKAGLAKFPDADADKDGILTMEEARTFLRERPLGGRFPVPKPHTIVFEPSDDELAAIIRLGREKGKGGPLQFEKGKGLRIVMTGHSWVAPGRTSLLKIAAAAGLDGHQQRHHSGGGATGSANAIWLKEFGKSSVQE